MHLNLPADSEKKQSSPDKAAEDKREEFFKSIPVLLGPPKPLALPGLKMMQNKMNTVEQSEVGLEIKSKVSLMNSINKQITAVNAGGGMASLAKKLALTQLKKSVRAQKSDLLKEKHQLESIMIDLGVDLMTGNLLRSRVETDLTFKQMETSICGMDTEPEKTSSNQVAALVQICKRVNFFFEQTEVPVDDDYLKQIAKHLKYRYVKKGTNIRKAGNSDDRLYFIMMGKVACSFPTERPNSQKSRGSRDQSAVASLVQMAGKRYEAAHMQQKMQASAERLSSQMVPPERKNSVASRIAELDKRRHSAMGGHKPSTGRRSRNSGHESKARRELDA